MNTTQPAVRRRNLLVRYYVLQARVYLRVLRAARIIPPSIEASLTAKLRGPDRSRGI
jgi:hypothetical protein